MNLPKLRDHKVYFGTYRDVTFKIVTSKSVVPRYNDSWCYYIFIRENKCTNFESIWLPEKVTQYIENGPKHITYDYYSEPLGSIKMHGGITYYDKHGYTPGHRCVEIGCDYQHYWDEGKVYVIEDIVQNAMETIDYLYENGNLISDKVEKKEQ